MSDTVDQANEILQSYEPNPEDLGVDPERQAEIDEFTKRYDDLEAARDAGTINPEAFAAAIADLQGEVDEARRNAPKVTQPRIGGIAIGAGVAPSNIYGYDKKLPDSPRVFDPEDDNRGTHKAIIKAIM